MNNQEFPTFAEWKEQFVKIHKNEKEIHMTNKQLVDAYINEKEGHDEMKKFQTEQNNVRVLH